MPFRYFTFISLLKRAWSFISTKLNSLYQRMFCAKESGRIRRRFDMNVDISKAKKITDESCAFSNAIRLTVFLITGKLVKFYQNVFCFFKIWFWIGQYDRFHMIIDKIYFVFKEFVVSLYFLHEFEMCYGCIFQI